MNGILNINKPAGMTSHDVVDKLRRILKEKKAGHTGTLDPNATGVLPVCLGKATKIIQYLQDDEKAYEGTMTLGIVTETLDSEGKILSVRDSNNIDSDQIKKVFEGFRGEIEQIPPMVSAIKFQGKRLYSLARQGKSVDRIPRRVKIYDLGISGIYEGKDAKEPSRAFTKIDFWVRCSKGTYVRSLASDIGNSLGCGAYLSRLVRTKSGIFALKDSIRLEEIQNNPESAFCRMKSIDEVLSFMPMIVIDNITRSKFLNGISVSGSRISYYDSGFQMGKLIRVHDEVGTLLGICKAMVDDPATSEPSAIACKTIKVLK